ncbi:MAG: hypothetical protein JO297_12065, partial [Nitrososphaeraceae archaeon]|nr:hypothetical protein [Nitrososphaeraceae archaeon]
MLDALTEAYPTGLNANELVQRTGLPLKTVYSALKELNRELFINELGKQRKVRGRPLQRSVQSNEGERQSAKYVIEDIGRIYDHFYSSPDEANYAMSPGNVDYPDEFIDAWHKVVQKEEEEDLCIPLLHFVEKMVTRISEHESDQIKRWTPEDKNYC